MIHIAKKKTLRFTSVKTKAGRERQRAAIRDFYIEKRAQKDPRKLVSVLLKRHRDSQGNHHHVILEDIDDRHVSVGTSSKAKKGKNSTNYKCDNDIIGNGEQSYLRRQGIVDFKINYSDPKQGRMTEKDYAQAKIYGQRAKEKYLAQKKKK